MMEEIKISQKSIKFMLLVLLMVIPVYVVADNNISHLIITEVCFNPRGDEPECEFIEIYNPSKLSVSLAGYKIGDEEEKGKGEGMYKFPDDAVIEPKSCIVIAGNSSAFYKLFNKYPDFEVYPTEDNSIPDMIKYEQWATRKIALSNTGDQVLLLNENDEIVDMVIWEKEEYFGTKPYTKKVKEGHSIERINLNRDTDDCAIDFVDKEQPTPGIVMGISDINVQDDSIYDILSTGFVAGIVATSSITIRWNLPQDVTSVVSSYQIRYATYSITEDTWDTANIIDLPDDVFPKGSFTLTGLLPDTVYYFGAKVTTYNQNTYDLFNIGRITTSSAIDRQPLPGTDDEVQTQTVTTGKWYAGDMHLHTSEYSHDGESTIQEMVSRARELGYSFIAITDHSNKHKRNIYSAEIWQKAKQDYLRTCSDIITVLPGHEISSAEVKTGPGPHLNVIGKDIGYYQGNTELDVMSIIDNVTAENGIITLNHPFVTVRAGGSIPWDKLITSTGNHVTCIEDRYYIPGDKTMINHDPQTIGHIYSLWDEGICVWINGSSDAHYAQHRVYGREFSMVYAQNDTYNAIMNGIKAGHMYIVYNGKSRRGKGHIGVKGIPTFSFTVSCGTATGMIGDILNVANNEVELHVNVEAADKNTVRRVIVTTNSGKIIHDEIVNTRKFKRAYTHTLAPGWHWFTVDVCTSDWDRILSNPIFVNISEDTISQPPLLSCITGTITASGNPCYRAVVSVCDEKTENIVSVYTDRAGKYKIDNLVLGTYTISVSAEGYRGTVTSVILNTTEPLNIAFELNKDKLEFNFELLHLKKRSKEGLSVAVLITPSERLVSGLEYVFKKGNNNKIVESGRCDRMRFGKYIVKFCDNDISKKITLEVTGEGVINGTNTAIFEFWLSKPVVEGIIRGIKGGRVGFNTAYDALVHEDVVEETDEDISEIDIDIEDNIDDPSEVIIKPGRLKGSYVKLRMSKTDGDTLSQDIVSAIYTIAAQGDNIAGNEKITLVLKYDKDKVPDPPELCVRYRATRGWIKLDMKPRINQDNCTIAIDIDIKFVHVPRLYNNMAPELSNTQGCSFAIFKDTDSEVLEDSVITSSTTPKAYPYPNPFNPVYTSIKIEHSLPNAKIKIFNIAGELIKELPQGELNWDGRNEAGKMVSSGVYIYIIDNGDKCIKGKIGVVK